ncbi:MAG: hypothetical protein AAB296_05740 [Candidatus Desantisbacteria bacterium]
MPEEKEEGLTLDKKTMDVLVANIIPTSKYFEIRFDYLQQQVDTRFDYLQQHVHDVKLGVMSLEDRMNKRFEQVDKRFEQIDKRFEQIDNRFATIQSDMDKRFDRIDNRLDDRFEQIGDKLDKLLARVDVKIDAGLRENRGLTVRLFTFAMMFAAISMAGLFGRMLKIF